MSIVKAARGLPRFMADCGFWRHPKWVGTDLAQIGLFTTCLSYCYEHETDGQLPGPELEDLSSALGLKPRHVKPALAALLSRGSLAVSDTGFVLVGFDTHNPTSVEIREHREKKSAAGRKGAAARWSSESDSEPECESHTNRMAHRNARVEESRVEKNIQSDRIELDFDTLWKDYPRKEARLSALKAYRARRAQGVSHSDLVTALANFIPAMARRDRENILHGSTFFGPDERWKDYLQPLAASNGHIDTDAYFRQFDK